MPLRRLPFKQTNKQTIWMGLPVGLSDVHALRHHVTIDMADASGGLDSGSPAKGNQALEIEINAKVFSGKSN